MVPRRRNPKPYVPAKDPLLTAQEALNIAATMDMWPGSYARVLKDGKPILGGYRPFVPPPPGCST